MDRQEDNNYENPDASKPMSATNNFEEYDMTEINDSFQQTKSQESMEDSLPKTEKDKFIKFALAIILVCANIAVLLYIGVTMSQLLKNSADMRESLGRELNALKREIFQLAAKANVSKDCSEVYPNEVIKGNKTMGVFQISVQNKTIHAYCDLKSDEGRWTVIQRRMDGSVNFYRGIIDYVIGFGSASGEFWIGLENIYNIVEGRKFEMRIDLEDWNGVKKFAKYSFFGIGNRHEDYRLNISGYSGTAGDAMTHQNGQRFSSKDHDVDSSEKENCAQKYNGSWWYGNCHHSNLNGLYHKGSHASNANGINWKQWKGYRYSLRFVEMKIRPIIA